MKMYFVSLFLLVLVFLSLITALIAILTNHKILTKISLACYIVFAILCVFNTSLYSHGAQQYSSPKDMFIHLINTPEEDNNEVWELIENSHTFKQTIIYFYRFDCWDCTRSYDKTMEFINTLDCDVYFISTRSEYGKELCRSYDVYNVPSIVAFNKNGESETFEIYSENKSAGYVDSGTIHEIIDFLNRNGEE